MYEIDTKLEKREKEGKPILVGLIGAGQMGTEIITTIGEMVGMKIGVVVDLSIDLAAKGYEHSKKKYNIVKTDDYDKAKKALDEGKSIAATNYKLATALPQIDAIIDATGSIQMGAIISMDAINNKKHVVMMNVECDITIGPILRQMADNAGVVYSLAAGDEPAAIVELFRFAKALGFEIVAAGKGKNNPLDITATPDMLAEKAKARDMSATMLCEFVDGSKTAIEMAAVSNATGLVPDIRGMHGPKTSRSELNKTFALDKDGGVLKNKGVVDYAIGVHPGVFVIVTTDNERLKWGLIQRDMGNGPYYTLFRPFHLCSIEVPLTVAQAVIYGESSGHPMRKLNSECIVVAKKEIKKGETLDGIGEFCYRASIEEYETAKKERLLPLGLAKGCVANQDITIGTEITYDMVDIVQDTVLLQMRKLQDQLMG